MSFRHGLTLCLGLVTLLQTALADDAVPLGTVFDVDLSSDTSGGCGEGATHIQDAYDDVTSEILQVNVVIAELRKPRGSGWPNAVWDYYAGLFFVFFGEIVPATGLSATHNLVCEQLSDRTSDGASV